MPDEPKTRQECYVIAIVIWAIAGPVLYFLLVYARYFFWLLMLDPYTPRLTYDDWWILCIVYFFALFWVIQVVKDHYGGK